MKYAKWFCKERFFKFRPCIFAILLFSFLCLEILKTKNFKFHNFVLHVFYLPLKLMKAFNYTNVNPLTQRYSVQSVVEIGQIIREKIKM